MSVPDALAVILVGNFLSSIRGSRGVCEELAPRLEAAGWHVLTTSNRRARTPRLVDMVATAWRWRCGYTVAQVDVYSGPSFLWAEAVCWVLRRARKPYVLTLHGGNLPTFARRWPGRVRRLLSSAAAVTAPSGYLWQQMRTYRPDLRLLPNPLDLRAYACRVRTQPHPALVWVRAFCSIYNPSLAPRVLALLAEAWPEAHLTMVGPDKHDGSLRRLRETASGLGVLGRIALPGGVAKGDVPDWLDKADIFLNTTNVDNTPVSVMEAMASGLCIVSTNVGGIPYLLEHERDALLVPPDDPEAMAGAVRRILTEPGLARRVSSNARRKAEGFDWSVVLPRWQELLSAVAEGRLA